MSTYLELKLSWELYQRPPRQLAEAESVALGDAARRQQVLETRILSSPEAAQAVVVPAAVADRVAAIRARYDDETSYVADLRQIGLDPSGLEAEVARDLRIEAVLDRVTASVAAVTELDAELFYQVHRARFTLPERRSLRHILLTFSGPAEKLAAQATLDRLRGGLATVEGFADAALRHSHCPTALEGGMLGTLPRGKLYAELEAEAFALPAGGISGIVETDIGLHLLRCDEIHPEGALPFAEVRERIADALAESRRKSAIKSWLRSLTLAEA